VYRWRYDNGDQATATWRQNEDTQETVDKLTPIRLRIRVDATGNPNPTQFKLQYREKPGGTWTDVGV
jgi:hypothetical protein